MSKIKITKKDLISNKKLKSTKTLEKQNQKGIFQTEIFVYFLYYIFCMRDTINYILYYPIWGNDIIDYFKFVIIFFILFCIMRFVFIKLISHQTKAKKKNLIAEALINVPKYIYILIEFCISIKFLNLGDVVLTTVNWFLIFGIVMIILNIVNALVIQVIYPLVKDNKKTKKYNATIKNLIKNLIYIVVWSIWILFFLDNVWVEITPMLASLWVASIAVAFALQNILSDLFSSFSIILTPYYKVWDFIEIIWWPCGEITNINMKNTVLLSSYWEEVIIPNSKLISSNVLNYGNMKYRKKDITLWIVYWTKSSKLKKAIEIVKKSIESTELCTCDRVHLTSLWDYSINIKFRFKYASDNYNWYLDSQQAILFKIMEQFEKEKIEFAFPTQTIFTQKAK